MTPPLTLQNCPESFQKNPLPFDKCAPANPSWKPPQFRFPQLSAGLEYNYLLAGRGETGSFAGVSLLWRPIFHLGIGTQFNTNFDDQVQFLGRVQTSFNIQRHGMAKGTIAALAGLNHFIGQRRLLAGEPWNERSVDGTAFTAGGEMAMDFRVFTWMTFAPFARLLYQPETELKLHIDGSTPVRAQNSLDLTIGLKLDFDFFEKGN